MLHVAILEYGRLRIRVDRKDVAGLLHACLVLMGPGDAAGNVEFGEDLLASLAHEPLLRCPANVHGNPGGCHGASQATREILE